MGTDYKTIAGNGERSSAGRIGTDVNTVAGMEEW
jgi:hypothetical protein